MSRRGSPTWNAAANGSRADGRWRRVLRDPLFSGAIALLGFFVLSWPLVSSPSMSVAAADVFVFGVWASFIAMLAAIARAVRPAVPRQREDDDA